MFISRNFSIVLIDDDTDLCELLKAILMKEGFRVEVALSGEIGVREVTKIQPDLVLLDIMMPDMNGWNVAKKIRLVGNVPIIVLSALSQTSSIVRALEAGADDFVAKPFNKKELIARIKAIIRRTAVTKGCMEHHHDYDDGHLCVDLKNASILVKGKPLYLSPTEYRLFEYLFLNSGRACETARILTYVWRDTIPNGLNYIHVYIWKLRNKIELDHSCPEYILTEHGIGYRFILHD